MAEPVSFRTRDGVDIAGLWSPAPGATRFALLLHMRPATKESWAPWIAALNARGVSCLAFDQRGHGESTMGGTLNQETFTDEQHQAKELDLEAAWAWLKGEGAAEKTLVLVGASIGANLAIRFLAVHPRVPLALALSPGLNYRGVTTGDAVVRLGPGQRVVLVASDDDDFESGASCRQLHALAPEQTVLVETRGLGHGTRMTEKNPPLIDELLAFL